MSEENYLSLLTNFRCFQQCTIFKYFNTSPEVTRLVVMMYIRYWLCQSKWLEGDRAVA